MPSFTNTRVGLPASPRATRPKLPSLNTAPNFSRPTTAPSPSSATSTLSSSATAVPLHSPSSLIFINATVPLSPASTTSSSSASTYDALLLDGLAPRKRSGLARLFCCFGREERARRRVERETGFEKVGGMGHWSEY